MACCNKLFGPLDKPLQYVLLNYFENISHKNYLFKEFKNGSLAYSAICYNNYCFT